ncbi:TIGR03364 family FAD-dependent oxidoreductase [Acinetobacter baumannii]|uniref:TIGR03364 family FAD-dependent oxidoreductase n=1 Tax=Acinetobacter baumannii TaxID=470 RepID=UPI00233F7949|nr:TIGR03364 family FAD-dependent oxidoreductase [Acinetobacter baumannii]MDC5293660.1 TIGR03364 family FAD-dependent oxidoreductase [Acinetobacter baumannii]MDC5441189.1 TIGR03364 family FAD-dependent oxidoreductase [Acinetobacter baumannii]MDO7457515.1 TIGR03364 family FAD-dependent oxidoreductase [Acinetobacter baumannii]MDV4328323.1 TIGR03364 family FAD-dependent oxidoreductase [Acinetobacter baumannii]MDV4333232.1 TIGR03364 family FAD-dependent oxidoreductase [Acinetobacter baumannii]
MNHVQFDLIVVGAGILGLSAAIQAQEQGLKVCIFEKNTKPVGATHRNFGMVGTSTLTHPEQQWRKYALETRSFYQRIQAETDISFAQRQGVYLANTALEWQVLNEFAEHANNYQIPVHLFSHEELVSEFSYLNPSQQFQGGLVFEEDYSVEPHVIGQRLLAYAERNGVEIYTNACVVQTQYQQESCQVRLASGKAYRANKVLICHGEVIDVLYPDLLQSLNLKRCGLQMALTQPFHQNLNASLYSGLSISRYPAFEICPSHAELVKASQQGFIKEFGIHILIKQNEFGELIVGDSHEYHSINEAPQFEQREEINEFIQAYCHEKLGLTLPPIQKRWNGYYLTHEHELACVTEAEKNIFLVSAIAGKGMTTGAGFMQEVLTQNIY